MEPNSDNLWSVSIDSVFETQGFARSVTIEGSKAFVAAGQSGSQIWDLSGRSLIQDFMGYEEGGTFLEFEEFFSCKFRIIGIVLVTMNY